MELVTETLTPKILEAELPRIVEWLRARSVRALQITFGVGSNAPMNELWTPIPVNLEDFAAFVQDAINSGRFTFGESDLHIYDSATLVRDSDRTFHCNYPALTFSFCHESDLHFAAQDVELVAAVKADWISRGYKGYESEEVHPRDWKPFG
ncbi:MAG: hypothetical protein ABI972_13810 [Acidobacteriota bacterium]